MQDVEDALQPFANVYRAIVKLFSKEHKQSDYVLWS